MVSVYNVRIDPELYAQCKQLAEKEHRSISNFINHVLACSLQGVEPQLRVNEAIESLSLRAVPEGQTGGNTIVGSKICRKGHYYKGARCLQPECQ